MTLNCDDAHDDDWLQSEREEQQQPKTQTTNTPLVYKILICNRNGFHFRNWPVLLHFIMHVFVYICAVRRECGDAICNAVCSRPGIEKISSCARLGRRKIFAALYNKRAPTHTHITVLSVGQANIVSARSFCLSVNRIRDEKRKEVKYLTYTVIPHCPVIWLVNTQRTKTNPFFGFFGKRRAISRKQNHKIDNTFFLLRFVVVVSFALLAFFYLSNQICFSSSTQAKLNLSSNRSVGCTECAFIVHWLRTMCDLCINAMWIITVILASSLMFCAWENLFNIIRSHAQSWLCIFMDGIDCPSFDRVNCGLPGIADRRVLDSMAYFLSFRLETLSVRAPSQITTEKTCLFYSLLPGNASNSHFTFSIGHKLRAKQTKQCKHGQYYQPKIALIKQ